MGHTLRQIVRTVTSTALPALKEQQVKLGKFNINYTQVGHGPHKLVFIPGTLGTIRSHYGYQVNAFDKEKFTLVIFDPQGFGRSVPPERILTKESYQADADTAYELMKYLNIPKYSVMGWSAGGGASMLHAAQHPEQVKKLVIWCTSSHFHKADIAQCRRIRQIDSWGSEIKREMIETYTEEGFARLWKQWVDHMLDPLEVDSNISSHQLKNITCPTFILQGQKDKLIHPSHFPFLCYHIKNSKYFLYPQGKHDIHMKYADDFNQRVQEFLLEE